MKAETLAKPCPFCGKIPDLANDSSFWLDEAGKWGAIQCCCVGPEVRTGYLPIAEWMADALSEWNKRAALRQSAAGEWVPLEDGKYGDYDTISVDGKFLAIDSAYGIGRKVGAMLPLPENIRLCQLRPAADVPATQGDNNGAQ